MPGKFVFLLNAAIFGSLAALGTNAHRSSDANAVSRGATAAKPLIATKSVATQLVSSHGLPGTAPKTALSSATSDAVVPPIVRRRPAGGTTVAAVEPENTKKTVKGGSPAAKASNSAAAKSQAVKSAAITPGNNKQIDLTGRSALGAAPKGVKCTTGQKYDTKQLKCVAAKSTAAPKSAVAAKQPAKVVKSSASAE